MVKGAAACVRFLHQPIATARPHTSYRGFSHPTNVLKFQFETDHGRRELAGITHGQTSTFQVFGFKDTTLTGVGEINSSFTIITILGIKKQVKCLHVEHAGRHGVIRYIVTAAQQTDPACDKMEPRNKGVGKNLETVALSSLNSQAM